jgi:CubicO group peptidase (beta-lactamase class C family)
MDPANLTRTADAFAELPEARALLVTGHGHLILERYFNGMRPRAPWNVKSVTKSVQSALVGIAIDDGLLDLDDRVAALLPSYFAPLPDGADLGWASWVQTSDELRREISVRDILTMRSSLRGSDLDDTYVTLLAHAPDQVAFSAKLPMDGPPGTSFRYNTANAMLLNGIIAASTGTSPLAFAQERLFGPMGSKIARWQTDQTGLEIGGAELHLTATDMARFALLYLGRGEFADRRILSVDFVDASLAMQVRFEPPPNDAAAALLPDATGYGFMWWHRNSVDREMVCAWGYGGQFICLVPSLDLAVITQSTAGLNEEYHHQLFDVVDRLLVLPLE